VRFLANENFPAPGIKLLRQQHIVLSITELSPGISDVEVIRKALDEKLIILTFDRDYGEIIFKHRSLPAPSIIYFRFKGKAPQEAARLLIEIIESGNIQFENNFTVIDENSIRQRNY